MDQESPFDEKELELSRRSVEALVEYVHKCDDLRTFDDGVLAKGFVIYSTSVIARLDQPQREVNEARRRWTEANRQHREYVEAKRSRRNCEKEELSYWSNASGRVEREEERKRIGLAATPYPN